MGNLLNTLVQRHMGTRMPTVVPSIPAKVPPQATRWANAQKIQDAYANDWSPNPILLRAMLGHR